MTSTPVTALRHTLYGTLAATVLGAVTAAAPAAGLDRGRAGSQATSVTATTNANWNGVARGPLSAREYANGVWTGKEVLVFGGDTGSCDGGHCGPNVPPQLRDGAAYNPKTNKWRKIATAPTDLYAARTALAGGTVYVLAYGTADLKLKFLSYSIRTNRWKTLKGAVMTPFVLITPVAGKVIAYTDAKGSTTERDHLYDPATGKWRQLPADPAGPNWARSMGEVNGRAVVVGSDPGDIAVNSEDGWPLIASRLDLKTLKWTALLDSPTSMAAGNWWPVAGRFVNATTYHPAKNTRPYGGILDPAGGGTWTSLPAQPKVNSDIKQPFHWNEAAGGSYAVWGRFALNVKTRKWTAISALPALRGEQQGITVVWAGSRLFVWGGARYAKVISARATGWTWSPTPTPAPPKAR